MSNNMHGPFRGTAGEMDTIRALLHDLREPLAAIRLLSGTTSGDVQRKMMGINDQARWLAELVEAVLGEGAPEGMCWVDVREIAAGAVRRARHTAPCEIALDGHGEVQAWADPVALGRALACVMDNAIRAAGPLGHVVVRASVQGAYVILRVTDDGPGLGNIASRTSLGLTTTRAMVAACHGAFRLYPAEGGGTIADIQLRRAAVAPPVAAVAI